MIRPKFSLTTLLWLVTCSVLLLVALREHRRANELESQRFVMASKGYRALLEQDWEILKREIQLRWSQQELKSRVDARSVLADESQSTLGDRRALANLRNAELKLEREKKRRAAIRDALILEATPPNN